MTNRQPCDRCSFSPERRDDNADAPFTTIQTTAYVSQKVRNKTIRPPRKAAAANRMREITPDDFFRCSQGLIASGLIRLTVASSPKGCRELTMRCCQLSRWTLWLSDVR